MRVKHRLLLPPFVRYRCFVVISPAFRRSRKARRTVDSDSFSSLAIVGIAGQHSPYQKQTEHRDELRKVSRERIEEIVRLINEGGYDNPVVEEKLALLAERLSRTKGKKQYGYLKSDVKAIVCSIVAEQF